MPPSIDVEGILLIPIMTGMLVAVCYGIARAARSGESLTRLQKQMILYACAFAFGMGYAIVFQEQLALLMHWKNAWIAVTVAWGLLLGAAALLVRSKVEK